MLLLQTTYGLRVKLGYNIKFINISSHLIGFKIHLFFYLCSKANSVLGHYLIDKIYIFTILF